MDMFVKKNQTMLLTELENRCVSLKDDAKEFLELAWNQDGDDICQLFFRGETVNFELLSSKNLLEFDKYILGLEEKRQKFETIRSLRIAGSHVLVGAKFLIVLADTLKSLVIYSRDGEDYIVDYANNLIMKDEDYKKICPYKVVEEINQRDLCYVAELIKKGDKEIPLPLVLTCFGEIKRNLQRSIPDLAKRYYSNGINRENDFVLNVDNETLFWLDVDYYSEYSYDANVIDRVTINPLGTRLPIERVDDTHFRYKDYEFRLLSDYVIDDEQKRELLSDERVGKCFSKSIETLFGLGRVSADRKKVVLGNIKIRERENFYHAVTMFKSAKKNLWNTVDYTINLIMESDKYAELKNYTIINEIPYEVMDNLYEYLEQWNLQIDKFLLLYFGEEILKDLERNKSLFKGMK